MSNWSSRRYESQRRRSRDYLPNSAEFFDFDRQETIRHSETCVRTSIRQHRGDDRRMTDDVRHSMSDFSRFKKTGESLRQDQGDTWPSDNRRLPNNTRHSFHGVTSNVGDKSASIRTVASDRYQTDSSNELTSDVDFVQNRSIAGRAQITSNKMFLKRPHYEEKIAKVPSKLLCKPVVAKTLESGQNATNLSVGEQQKHESAGPVDKNAEVSKTADSSSADGKLVSQKAKRPAENLTIGTLFDLESHLDAARKKMRRDFDADSVTIVRQSDEGLHLLNLRPEFNGTATVNSVAGDNTSAERSPLVFSDTDVNSAVRLGRLIAETIEQHVDRRKLEETARCVSHRLRHSAAKTNEREIVQRQRPILISTVPQSTSKIRHRVLQRNTKSDNSVRLSTDQQLTNHMTAKYTAANYRTAKCQQSKLSGHQLANHRAAKHTTANHAMAKDLQEKFTCAKTVPPLMSFVSPAFQRGNTVVSTVDNRKCSHISSLITRASDELKTSSEPQQTVRRIIIGRKKETALSFSPRRSSVDSSKLPSSDNSAETSHETSTCDTNTGNTASFDLRMFNAGLVINLLCDDFLNRTCSEDTVADDPSDCPVPRPPTAWCSVVTETATEKP